MPSTAARTLPLRPADLPARKPTRFDLAPGPDDLAALADELGLIALRKLRFRGELRPDGRRDWRLEATLGATVVQPCVVTLEPVTTRIDEAVTRRYLAGMEMPVGEETEMPEDDSAEPLPEVVDIGAVMAEALALALPLYPRAAAAEAPMRAAPPGAAPLTDEALRPFAGLDRLLDRARDDDTGESGGGTGGAG
ncbi:MAG: DUF177 domain-containing protein [Rhodobacteraceae bacterium]|nr:DUF177 domain-containing protein [Paracoccaceae bacterium]